MTTQFVVAVECPLCGTNHDLRPVRGGDAREYCLCPVCHLVFVSGDSFVSPDAAKRHYLTHQNGPHHPGHVAFVRRLIEPLTTLLSPGNHGLDYGCGPTPVVPHLLAEEGMTCDVYDPFFARGSIYPPYDFVVSVEVFEHFRFPREEISRLCRLLKPGGLLALMTDLWRTECQLGSWYYMRDPTHVVFYHARTIDFICHRYGLTRCFDDDRRVVILRLGG